MHLSIDLTDLIIFLLGSIVGAFAIYLVNKFTDKRRKKEAVKETAKEFREVTQQMPELITDMRNDLVQEGNNLIREFFISKKSYSLNPGGKCFVYFE